MSTIQHPWLSIPSVPFAEVSFPFTVAGKPIDPESKIVRSSRGMVSLNEALACLSGHCGYRSFIETGAGCSPNASYVIGERVPFLRMVA